MERLNRMSLKQAFFWLTFWCMLGGAILGGLSVVGCAFLRSYVYPGASAVLSEEGMQFIPAPSVSPALRHFAQTIEILQLVLPVICMICAVILADYLFYRLKLKTPITELRNGAERIISSDLEFELKVRSKDELGALCRAFETMRRQMRENNRQLWMQAEERRRLNAAFSHDLRNPITVLKGTVQMMKRGEPNKRQVEQLERYTGRIEQYVEAMSGVGRLEALAVRPKRIPLHALKQEVFETARGLAPGCECAEAAPDSIPVAEAAANPATNPAANPAVNSAAEAAAKVFPEVFVFVDSALLLQTAENLISNAARYATCTSRVSVSLQLKQDALCLRVADDGPGFPAELLNAGPKPFQKGSQGNEDVCHFGMGLYLCKLLSEKMGGHLRLHNRSGEIFIGVAEAAILTGAIAEVTVPAGVYRANTENGASG